MEITKEKNTLDFPQNNRESNQLNFNAVYLQKMDTNWHEILLATGRNTFVHLNLVKGLNSQEMERFWAK